MSLSVEENTNSYICALKLNSFKTISCLMLKMYFPNIFKNVYVEVIG